MFKNKKIRLKSDHVKPPSSQGEVVTWINQFRNVYNDSKYDAKFWFWDNFNWSTQSIWIGKINKMNHLPSTNIQINNFLKKLIDDLNQYDSIKSHIYVKLYFSRNTTSGEPDINYLMICDDVELPEQFSNTLIDIMFEKYKITKSTVNKDNNIKNLINHYINWGNFYNHCDLIGEMNY